MNTQRSIFQIAHEIRRIWSAQGKGINYAAKPYLDAMFALDLITDSYGADSGRSVVLYFLSNATSFRGEDAKRLKQELKDHLEPPKKKKSPAQQMEQAMIAGTYQPFGSVGAVLRSKQQN